MYYLQMEWKNRCRLCLYRSGRSLHTAHFPAFQTGLHDTKQSVSGSAGCYGEIDITMNLLKDAMRIAPEMTIIVNGDDALSTYLAQESGNPYVTYGIQEQVFEEQSINEIKEGRFCKKCGAKLFYNFYHYSQLGDYHCPNCDFHRPELNYNASNVKTGKVLDFDANGEHIHVNYRGFYNVYNILAVYAAVKEAAFHFKFQ